MKRSHLEWNTLNCYLSTLILSCRSETSQQGSVTQLPSPGLFHDPPIKFRRSKRHKIDLLQVINSAADVIPQEVGDKCRRGVCGINTWWCLTPMCILQIQSSMSIKFEMSWETAKVQGNDTDLIKVYTRCKDWECRVNDIDVAPRHLQSSLPLAHRYRPTKEDHLRSWHFLRSRDLI